MTGEKFHKMRDWLMGWERHPGPTMERRKRQQSLGGGGAASEDVSSDEE
jgi:hypothetical protein